jgi:hypothetical protein
MIRVEDALFPRELRRLQRAMRVRDVAARLVGHARVLRELTDRADVAFGPRLAFAAIATIGRQLRMQFIRSPRDVDIELLLQLVDPHEADIAPRSDVVRDDRDAQALLRHGGSMIANYPT